MKQYNTVLFEMILVPLNSIEYETSGFFLCTLQFIIPKINTLLILYHYIDNESTHGQLYIYIYIYIYIGTVIYSVPIVVHNYIVNKEKTK